MQRTGPAAAISVVRTLPGAAPAADRHYIMRQKLLTIVAALSLMVSVVAGVLWVRSYWRADVIQFVEYRAEGAIRRYLNAVSEDGRLVVGAGTTQYIPQGPAGPGQPTFVVRASP